MVKPNPSFDKINLGCGTDILEGYLNVDFEKFKGVDFVCNLNKLPYPFKSSQFRKVYMRNVLEHLDNPWEVMKDVYRISSNGAIISLRVPHFSSHNAWGDLQHKRGFNTDTFKNDNVKHLFEIIKQEITFPRVRFFMRVIANKFPSFYEKNLAYILPATDLVVHLRVRK